MSIACCSIFYLYINFVLQQFRYMRCKLSVCLHKVCAGLSKILTRGKICCKIMVYRLHKIIIKFFTDIFVEILQKETNFRFPLDEHTFEMYT